MAYTPNDVGNGHAYTSAIPTMDTVQMGLEVSRQVLPKIFAKEAYHKGYMVNDRYNAELQNSLDVLIPKFNRPTGKFVNIRSGSYDPFRDGATNDRVHQQYDLLTIDMEYNEIIEIAEDQIVQNIQGNGVITTMVDMLSSVVAEQINVLTAEGIYAANLEYNSGKGLDERKIEYVDVNSESVSIPDKIASAIAKIGNADADKGDTSFNDYKVSQVISNTLYANLMKTKNQFLLESSYGQELLIDGTFGEITLGGVYAFKGKILGVYTFVLPDNFFPKAGNTLFSHKPTAGKVYGIMGVAEATERAFIDRGVKIVDAKQYRGWELQPLYRCGVNCVKPWGTALLVSTDFVDADLAAPVVEGTVAFTGGTAAGDTKFSSAVVTGATSFLVADGDTATAGYKIAVSAGEVWKATTQEFSGKSEGDIVSVLALDANGKTVGIVRHKLEASEIKTA